MTYFVIEKNTRNAKILSALRFLWRILPSILLLIYTLLMLPLLKYLAPYVSGDEVLENPLTTSQISAMLLMLIVVYSITMLSKIVKKIGKK